MWDEDDALEWLEELSQLSGKNTQLQAEEAKFDLYLRAREFKQVSKQLRTVLLLPQSQRDSWIAENEELLNDLLEEYLEDTLRSLHGLKLDAEGMELSVELVTNMRDTMNIVQTMKRRSDRKY